jgi:outer membrane protein OmpA-like peptidoglycan-associated protein/opacity protein-like surface antigen
MRFLIAAAVAAGLLAAAPAFADATVPTKDIAGAKDHPQVQRYDGSFIVDSDSRAFTDIVFPLAVLESTGKTGRNNNQEMAPKKKLELEGARTRLVYVVPEGRSPLEVLRNYQQDITAKGGQKLYECKGSECGGNATYGTDTGGGTQGLIMYSYPDDQIRAPSFSNGRCAVTSNIDDQRYGVMKFSAGGTDSYISVHAYVMHDTQYCKALDGRTIVIVNVLDMKPREQKMVTVAADAMNKEMNANGSVAIYGILFDFDKADVKPESKPQLDEIAKLLKANPKLHVLIVGHTDNKGQLGYNQTLSSKRAASVVAKLAKDYGIPAGQMTAVGVGPAAPVATNDTEAGQAKNRRVELVKM